MEAAVDYAKVREQFGRTIGTFQAIKHHLANMLVAAESATATVWDAARAAESATEDEFALMAACAATLTFPAYVHNAELNIQVHGGIGFTWEHDAHLHLRRALTVRGLFGGREGPTSVYELTAKGVVRENSIDLPPEAEQLRAEIGREFATWPDLDEKALRERMIETGYLMPHWPRPWGRAADAVEQLVIEQEMAAAGIKRPDFGITGWVVLTLIQHGTPEQIERLVAKALRGDAGVVPAVLRTRRRIGCRRGQYQGGAHRRRLDHQRAEGLDQWCAVLPARSGDRAHRPGGVQARRHHHGHHRHDGAGRRGAAAAADHRAVGVQRGVLHRCVRARPAMSSAHRTTAGRSRGPHWATNG